MTDIIEGVIAQVMHWKDGKGADVLLHNEEGTKYFYFGDMKLPLGQACEIEVSKGEGKHKGEWEIISASPLKMNPVPPPQGMRNALPGAPPEIVQMPFSKFKQMYDAGNRIEVNKVALDMAIRLYTALGKKESNSVAAANDVVEIAGILSGFLA